MKHLYLTINVCSVLVPFIFSFHPKIGFNKHFKAAALSLAIVALPFILWDMYFTSIGVWGFRSQYITGLHVGNIPVEEVMFFLFIPFSCLFTYFTLKRKLVKNRHLKHESLLGGTAAVLLLGSSLIFSKLYYTSFTFLFLSVAIAVFTIFFRRYFAAFIVSYSFLLIPFFITNGILTGSGIDKEVVWYNNNENLAIRILTIPIEDFFYGMLLILLNVMVFEKISPKLSVQYETWEA